MFIGENDKLTINNTGTQYEYILEKMFHKHNIYNKTFVSYFNLISVITRTIARPISNSLDNREKKDRLASLAEIHPIGALQKSDDVIIILLLMRLGPFATQPSSIG